MPLIDTTSLVAHFDEMQNNGTYHIDITQLAVLDYLSNKQVSFVIRPHDMTTNGASNYLYLDSNSMRLDYTLSQTSTVPEPTTIALMGLGAAGVVCMRRRQAQA